MVCEPLRSNRREAAVDHQFAARHEAGGFRAEIDHAAAELVRAAHAADRVVDLDALHRRFADSPPLPQRQSYVFPLGADISCLEYG